jgi:hypothetical protein
MAHRARQRLRSTNALATSNSSSRKSSASLTKPQQVPRMAGRNEFEMRSGGGNECEHQGA